jgi:D-alanyl-D-alanine carboxypeptidase
MTTGLDTGSRQAPLAVEPVTARSPRLTFANLVRSEWLKFWSVRSLPIILAVALGLVPLIGIPLAVLGVVQFDTLDEAAKAAVDPRAVPLAGVQLAVLVFGMLGAVALGGEYTTGAIRTTFLAAPRRGAVVLAKAVVLVAVVVPPQALVASVTFWIAQRILTARDLGVALSEGGVAPAIAGSALAAGGSALLGLAAGAVVRRSAGAIAALAVVLLLLPPLIGLVPGRAGRAVASLLPSAATGALSTVQGSGPDQVTLDGITSRWAATHPTAAADGGFTVAVVTGDGRVFTSAAGATADGTPLQPDDWMHMGSVTKTYVATALLSAQADGLLDLDDPVAWYLPGPPGPPGITVRELLNMTGGVPDYVTTEAWREGVLADPGRRWDLDEAASLIPDGAGERGRYAYSSSGYLMAGLVLEAVTGQDWEAAVRSRVLAPLGLVATDTRGEGHPVVPAVFLDGDDRPRTVTSADYVSTESTAGPAGGMAATAADLARFGRALLTGQALPAPQRDEMRQFGDRGGYGLGFVDFAVITRDGDDSLLHGEGNNGEIPGFGGVLLTYPESGTVVAMLRTSDRVDNLSTAAMVASGLGVDRRPGELTTARAAALLIGQVLVSLGLAVWLVRRRDA